MLQNPEEFNTAVQGLYSTQQQAILAGNNWVHYCGRIFICVMLSSQIILNFINHVKNVLPKILLRCDMIVIRLLH